MLLSLCLLRKGLMALHVVTEDPYIAATSANPELYRRCKRKNAVAESINLKDATETIDHERNMAMKKFTQEKAALRSELRKMLIDEAVLQRSDVTLDFPAMRQRRKSREFEDITLPSKLRSSNNLTAFAQMGRFKTEIVSPKIISRAMSDQRLNTLKDLKTYQHWEGDPVAINSVRRGQKSRLHQLEQTNFIRSRPYDLRNEPIKAVLPSVLTRQISSANIGGLKPLIANMPGNTSSPKMTRANSSKLKLFQKSPSRQDVKDSQTEESPENAENDTKVTKPAKSSKSAKGKGKVAADSDGADSKAASKQKRKSSVGSNKIQPL